MAAFYAYIPTSPSPLKLFPSNKYKFEDHTLRHSEQINPSAVPPCPVCGTQANHFNNLLVKNFIINSKHRIIFFRIMYFLPTHFNCHKNKTFDPKRMCSFCPEPKKSMPDPELKKNMQRIAATTHRQCWQSIGSSRSSSRSGSWPIIFSCFFFN